MCCLSEIAVGKHDLDAVGGGGDVAKGEVDCHHSLVNAGVFFGECMGGGARVYGHGVLVG